MPHVTFFRTRCAICDRRFDARVPDEENCPRCAEAIEAELDAVKRLSYFSSAAVRGRITVEAMSR